MLYMGARIQVYVALEDMFIDRYNLRIHFETDTYH